MKLKIFSYISVLLFTMAFAACKDDIIYNPQEIPDGEGDLYAEMTITLPNSVALGSRTPGNAIREIKSLCVLIYNKNGNLYRKVTQNQMVDYEETVNKDMPGDALDGNGAHQAQTETVGATFKLRNVPYGEYYIYAVANMGDLSAYEDKIQTVDGLKSIQVTWNSNDIAANNQMFGYFTMDGTPTSSLASAGFDAPLLTFVKTSTKIHSWIKRTVSKVTIAYDGGGLNDNVFVYVHNVTIHDIPNTCYIGQKNEPKNFNQLLNRPTATSVLPNTRFIYNDNGDIISPAQDTKGEPVDVFEKWMRVTNVNTNGENGMGRRGSDHSANAEALFFFENMQGDYDKQDKYNKEQQKPGDPDGVGENVSTPTYDENGNQINDFKDRVEYGTYIEVEGYYVSLNENNASQGPIKYRFMLGKNTTFNYDAQRNYHYKLTLGFKGWANQPDWHIEYEEDDPGIEVGPIIRMSYLYNTKSTMPVKLNGNCEELTLKIDENNWAPFDIDNDAVPDNPVPSQPTAYQFQWAKNVYEATNYGMNGVNRPYLGFLALQVPGNTAKDIPTNILETYSHQSKGPGQEALEKYFTGKGEGNSIPQDTRTFKGSDFSVGKHTAPQRNNDWEVRAIKDNDGNVDPHSTMLLVPLWTRNKTMIPGSNFSGNNTYEYYYRKAVVTLIGKFKVGNATKEVKTKCIVYQEPRIVNPKAVWRKAGSNSDFQVSLMQAVNSNAQSDYTPLVSVGTWRAYVEVSNNRPFIKLAKSDKTYGDMKDDTVCGKAGSPVDFKIEFPQTTTEAAPNYAVVTVEYHAENCTHKILVRQGYDEDTQIGGNYWSTYSLYSAVWTSGSNDGVNDTYTATLTKSPLAVGSFFRRGKQSAAIFPSNSNRGVGFQAMGKPGSDIGTGNNRVQTPATFNVARVATPNLTWSYEAENNNNTYAKGYLNFRDDKNSTRDMGRYTLNGRTYKVPDLNDFKALTDVSEFAFGVVYGEGATKTSDKFAIATGYEDNTNSGNGNANGVRAAIAYEATTGKQVIFPFGKYGMGRRRQNSFTIATTGNPNGNTATYGFAYLGSLWYSDVNTLLSTTNTNNGNWWRPVVYNLKIAPGAVYWIDKWVDSGTYSTNLSGKTVTYKLDSPSIGWDMNYVYLDFNEFSESSYADACLIKLIRTR
ncbi:MAG: hypothetical protein K2J12_09495 [Muribaculaceae bacterium]|nr:hypothetical protein [Muribaculaceae bacterium]